MKNERKNALLREIMDRSFAAVDTNLYLDGHPDNAEALAYYRENADELCRLTEAYEEEFGPLTAISDSYGDAWQWSKTSWPWQAEED